MPWMYNLKARALAFKAAVSRNPVQALSRAQGFFQGRVAEPPDRDTAEWMCAYATSPRLAPITKIAENVAGVQGKLYRRDAKGALTEIEQHPFLDFWRRPNPLPQMTSAALWRLMTVSRYLKGEAYAIIERDRKGCPKELWPVPSQWVQATPCIGKPYYVVRNQDGRQFNVPVEDMYAEFDLDPSNPYGRGLGIAEAVADEVETDEYMAKFAKRFFFNDATPATLVTLPEATDEQIARFRASWDSRYRGIGNAHKLGILPYEGATVTRLSESPKEMDFTESRRFLRDAVNQHFGVPPELLGITENSNRATSENAKAIFAENVLQPFLRTRQDAVNAQLLAQFGDEALLWEYEDVIPEDSEFRINVIGEAFMRGAVDVDEYREALGLDADPVNGKVRYVPVSSVPYSADESMTDMDLSAYPDLQQNREKGRDTKGFTRHHRQRVQQRMAREQMRLRRQCTPVVQSYMQKQSNAIVQALDGRKADDHWYDDLLAALAAESEEDLWAAAQKIAQALLDWNAQDASLGRILRPVWENAFSTGSQVASQSYGIPAVQNTRLTQHLMQYGLARVQKINNTTRQKLASALARGVQAGESRTQLVDRVQTAMNANRERAQIIADTEVHTSIQSGSFESIRSSGAKFKTWLSSGDDATRMSHRLLNGRTIPMNERFENGCLYPGDPAGAPGEIIDCRCDVVPAEDDDAAQEAWDNEQRRLNEVDETSRLEMWLSDDLYFDRLDRSALQYRTAQAIPPIEGYTDVFIHGDRNGYSAYNKLTDRYNDILPERLAGMIRNTQSYKGGPVRLISCQTGYYPDGPAQQLADALGEIVMAPKETALVLESGEIVVSDRIAQMNADRMVTRSEIDKAIERLKNERIKMGLSEEDFWRIFKPRR